MDFFYEIEYFFVYYTPSRRVWAILQSPCPLVRLLVRSDFRNRFLSFYLKDFIFGMWLWHGGLYCVSFFSGLPHISTSCLLQDLRIFLFVILKTFVTDFSAFTWRNDFIFGIWLFHGDLYVVSPFQVYCMSTSCLPRDLEFFFLFAVMKIFVSDFSA